MFSPLQIALIVELQFPSPSCPLVLTPQHCIEPSLTTAQVCEPMPSSIVAVTPAPRSTMWTLPETAPLSVETVYLSPQHPTEPLSRITQVLRPGVTTVTARKPVEWLATTGSKESLVVPSPN